MDISVFDNMKGEQLVYCFYIYLSTLFNVVTSTQNICKGNDNGEIKHYRYERWAPKKLSEQ